MSNQTRKIEAMQQQLLDSMALETSLINSPENQEMQAIYLKLPELKKTSLEYQAEVRKLDVERKEVLSLLKTSTIEEAVPVRVQANKLYLEMVQLRTKDREVCQKIFGLRGRIKQLEEKFKISTKINNQRVLQNRIQAALDRILNSDFTMESAFAAALVTGNGRISCDSE